MHRFSFEEYQFANHKQQQQFFLHIYFIVNSDHFRREETSYSENLNVAIITLKRMQRRDIIGTRLNHVLID